MKKIICLLPLIILLIGCSLDSDEQSEPPVYSPVPIIATNLPESFTVGETFEVELTYLLPTDCHEFFAIQYNQVADVQLFGILTTLTSSPGCSEINESAVAKFEVVVGRKEFYTFKFWQGIENGEEVYLTVNVPVTEPATT